MTDDRLPLTVLGGWLGAGKTTWLRHQLRTGPKAHVLVNEAAGVAVDDALLQAAAGVAVLAGGCVCCEGQGGLVAALRHIVDRRSAGEPIPPLILETSGLADPAAILLLLDGDPILSRHIRLTEVVVLVDALNGAADLTTDALAVRQIRAASRLILTKTDAAPPLATARLVATLLALNPAAQVEAAVAGLAVPLPDLKADPLPLGTGLRPVTAVTLPLPPGVDWAVLSLWLSALIHVHGDRLIRIKGVIRTPAGRLLLQTVRQQVQPPEILPEGLGRDDHLAVIGEAPDVAALTASLARFLG
ncbi:MAG: GTP-binding protein [Tabrizicola sp.]|nr:GTP-binding protein [Tabrizicola sp.]